MSKGRAPQAESGRGTAAVQNAGASYYAPEPAPAFGVRLSFWRFPDSTYGKSAKKHHTFSQKNFKYLWLGLAEREEKVLTASASARLDPFDQILGMFADLLIHIGQAIPFGI